MKVTVALILANFEDRRGAAATELDELNRRLQLQQSKLRELGSPPWWRPYCRYSCWRLGHDERQTFAQRHEAEVEAEAYTKAIGLVSAGQYDLAIALLRGKAAQIRQACEARLSISQTIAERGIILQQAEELAEELGAMAEHLEALREAKAKSQA